MRDLIAAMKAAQAAVTTEHSSTVESEAKHETTAEADVKVTLLDSEEMKGEIYVSRNKKHKLLNEILK